MAEAPTQVRDAIAQTRAEVAEAIHALGERVDATRHAAEKLAEEADHLKSAASHATARVADVGQHALGSAARVADVGQHALGNAASQFKSTTPKLRVLVPTVLAAALAFGLLARLIAKRRRDVAEDPLEWEPTDL
jgi:methyl-accepting chemotaxis protein